VNFKAIAGGSPFNVAVGLRRLGVDSALFAGLSTDYLGRRLQQVLQDEEGVRADYLVDFAAPTTLAMVAVGANGSPHYSFRGEGCADRQLSLAHLPQLGDDVRGLHIGSFSLVVQPMADTLLTLVQRESGKRLITLDPNVRLNPSRTSTSGANVATLVQLADMIKVSDEDLSLLYPEQDPQRVIEGWLQHRCQLVFLTRGGEGATVFSRAHGSWSVPACSVKIADTVGAGDTFQAALITWLTEQGLDSVEGVQQLSREQIDAMLRFAVQAAALTCSKTGPDLPYRHQLS
jgi:fructokinase